MADETDKELGSTFNANLGLELRMLLFNAAQTEGVSESVLVRRFLVGPESLRDRYRKQVDAIIRDNGIKWLSGK